MPPSEKFRDLHVRLEKSEATVASFARIAEEYRAIRKATPAGPARDRLDALIKLNNDTLVTVKRSLMLNEEDLGRAERTADKVKA